MYIEVFCFLFIVSVAVMCSKKLITEKKEHLIFLLSGMIIMGAVYLMIVLFCISKYYDVSELYTSPFIKGEMILLASYNVRKIVNINKAPAQAGAFYVY